MAAVQVRYIVHDVDAAISLYTEQLGFELQMHPAPPFAMLSRGDLRLVLSAPNPAGGGGQPMPDAPSRSPAGGTDSQSKSRISPPRWQSFAGRESAFVTTSSPVSAASRSSSRIPRAIPLSCLNRSCLRLASPHARRDANRRPHRRAWQPSGFAGSAAIHSEGRMRSVGCYSQVIARYCIAEFHRGQYSVEHRRVLYDDAELVRAFEQRDVPERKSIYRVFFGGRFDPALKGRG
jgi:hypothetical protein